MFRLCIDADSSKKQLISPPIENLIHFKIQHCCDYFSVILSFSNDLKWLADSLGFCYCVPGFSPSASECWWPFQRGGPKQWLPSLTLHWEVSLCGELWREVIHLGAVSYCHCHSLNMDKQRQKTKHHKSLLGESKDKWTSLSKAVHILHQNAWIALPYSINMWSLLFVKTKCIAAAFRDRSVQVLIACDECWCLSVKWVQACRSEDTQTGDTDTVQSNRCFCSDPDAAACKHAPWTLALISLRLVVIIFWFFRFLVCVGMSFTPLNSLWHITILQRLNNNIALKLSNMSKASPF